ncbi:hypothetical protein CSOJ01_12630 [Colletotrichum sojae]|uniref:Uncharacterized protein n=1 Tax=Colletotrichum sojae TaxID=2175907 RepID=A0A8H6IUA7_9PEZI|nr:hypothetical protein CSOJ01_12630 [Colletotrichum sojae]
MVVVRQRRKKASSDGDKRSPPERRVLKLDHSAGEMVIDSILRQFHRDHRYHAHSSSGLGGHPPWQLVLAELKENGLQQEGGYNDERVESLEIYSLDIAMTDSTAISEWNDWRYHMAEKSPRVQPTRHRNVLTAARFHVGREAQKSQDSTGGGVGCFDLLQQDGLLTLCEDVDLGKWARVTAAARRVTGWTFPRLPAEAATRGTQESYSTTEATSIRIPLRENRVMKNISKIWQEPPDPSSRKISEKMETVWEDEEIQLSHQMWLPNEPESDHEAHLRRPDEFEFELETVEVSAHDPNEWLLERPQSSTQHRPAGSRDGCEGFCGGFGLWGVGQRDVPRNFGDEEAEQDEEGDRDVRRGFWRRCNAAMLRYDLPWYAELFYLIAEYFIEATQTLGQDMRPYSLFAINVTAVLRHAAAQVLISRRMTAFTLDCG